MRPAPQPGPLDNPMKGWCPYTDAGKIHQPYSMVFLYIPWSQLGPRQGNFQFEAWEKTWNVERPKGKHIIFRVYIDYPSLPSGLPSWLRAEGVRETAYKEHGGGKSPDYDDARMIKAMERLIAELGKRYDKHPRVAFIQMGLLGFWGEWHTWPREKMYASTETERRVIDAYRKAFPNKSLMVRYGRDYAGKQPWIGFHDDMFPEDTDNGQDWSFLSGLRTTGRTANWKRAVVGGEMTPNRAKQWLGRDYSTTTKMLERAHFTWIGPYCPPLERTRDSEFLRNSEQLVRRMGYEFQLTELKHNETVKNGEPLRVALKGRNNGVAPFYYPWSVEWALLNESGRVVASQKTMWDIRQWQPGSFAETAKLTYDVRPGSYRLAIGIRDPWLKRPTIRFANQLQVIDGWTEISKVTVTR